VDAFGKSRKSAPFLLAISALIHAFFFLYLTERSAPLKDRHQLQPAKKIYTKLVLETKKSESKSVEDPRKILETPMIPTEAPKKADRLADADHIAAQSTKLPDSLRFFDRKPGKQGERGKLSEAARKLAEERRQAVAKNQLVESPSQDARKMAKSKEIKSYSDLLPRAAAGLAAGEVDAGYADFIEEDLPVSDRIDMNTSEYRFIGYFTKMRQAIELVWNYPREAQLKALQGEVGLEFAILEDGHASQVKVLKSSGYSVLDDAIVKAIHEASPFAPLPKNIGRDRLVITGSFRYVLSEYAH
jgi:periplasmic protein TonB